MMIKRRRKRRMMKRRRIKMKRRRMKKRRIKRRRSRKRRRRRRCGGEHDQSLHQSLYWPHMLLTEAPPAAEQRDDGEPGVEKLELQDSEAAPWLLDVILG